MLRHSKYAWASIFAVCLAASHAVADPIPEMSPTQVDAALAAPEVKQGRDAMRDPKRDAEAIALFTKAAGQGNPVAEAYLGYLSYMGHGIEQNDRIAANWYLRSANHGFADAQFRLGLMYMMGRKLGSGRSLPRDDEEGVIWIKHAADGGNPMALDIIADRMGAPYTSKEFGAAAGKSEPPTKEDYDNLVKSLDLYRRAAAQHDQYAEQALCGLRGWLVPVPDDIEKWCDLAHQRPMNWKKLLNRPSVNGVDLSLLESDEFPMPPPVYE